MCGVAIRASGQLDAYRAGPISVNLAIHRNSAPDPTQLSVVHSLSDSKFVDAACRSNDIRHLSLYSSAYCCVEVANFELVSRETDWRGPDDRLLLLMKDVSIPMSHGIYFELNGYRSVCLAPLFSIAMCSVNRPPATSARPAPVRTLVPRETLSL